MRHAVMALLALMPGLAAATPPPSPAASPGEQCLAAVAAAEQRMRLPAGLLRSIALVESGQRNPETGRVQPWPWTINAAGTGYFFASREEAIAAVRSLQAGGIQSIDVGCNQVNLQHHPQAFGTLDSAFDPQTNADYAARFLSALHAALGSWPLAAAAYHSRTPELGNAYARRVMAAWPDAARHGPWPSPGDGGSGGGGSPGASVDYGIFTPEFAARLRRADRHRANSRPDHSVFTPEFAGRLRRMDQDRARQARRPGGARGGAWPAAWR